MRIVLDVKPQLYAEEQLEELGGFLGTMWGVSELEAAFERGIADVMFWTSKDVTVKLEKLVEEDK